MAEVVTCKVVQSKYVSRIVIVYRTKHSTSIQSILLYHLCKFDCLFKILL